MENNFLYYGSSALKKNKADIHPPAASTGDSNSILSQNTGDGAAFKYDSMIPLNIKLHQQLYIYYIIYALRWLILCHLDKNYNHLRGRNLN